MDEHYFLSDWWTAQSRISVLRSPGELYALLCDHSTLLKASSNPGSNNSSEDVHDAGFIAGAHRAMIANESLLHFMFKTRTAQLLQNRSADWARGFCQACSLNMKLPR